LGRRDFYIWLAFSGCRAGETMEMEVKNLDLDGGIALYPITKTVAFKLPLSKRACLPGRPATQQRHDERRR
jgi:integrase